MCVCGKGGGGSVKLTGYLGVIDYSILGYVLYMYMYREAEGQHQTVKCPGDSLYAGKPLPFKRGLGGKAPRPMLKHTMEIIPPSSSPPFPQQFSISNTESSGSQGPDHSQQISQPVVPSQPYSAHWNTTPY